MLRPAAGLLLGCLGTSVPAPPMFLHLGTYGKSIQALEFDAATGSLGEPRPAAPADNPSFLAWHPGGRALYAVRERGGGAGGVATYARGPDGSLVPGAVQPSGGDSPCHLAVDPSGRWLLVANYGDGSVAAFRLAEDGALGSRTGFARHEGSGPNAARQSSPHAHGITFAPDGRHVLVPDLGIDRIVVYRLDPVSGTLAPAGGDGTAPPGSGPRHAAFHPGGRWLFAVHELDSTLGSYSWDAAGPALALRHVAPLLPAGWTGPSTAAEVAVHPDGRWLYASNRGHDSIVILAIDPATGALRPVGHVPAGGRNPRHFTLSPDGRWLLAALQDDRALAVFRVDAATGALTRVGPLRPVPERPVCLVFGPPRS